MINIPHGCKDLPIPRADLVKFIELAPYWGYFINSKRVTRAKALQILKNNVSENSTIKISNKWRLLKWSQGDVEYFQKREVKQILQIDVA